MRFCDHFLSLLFALGISFLLAGTGVASERPKIDFNRDVRSILSNNCLTCHGPDDAERQGGLRLDRRDGALAEADSGLRAVVPGKPEESELLARVASDDESIRMPPAESGKQLSQQEVEILTQWIREGAEYSQHWSYVKPVRPPLPKIADSSLANWPRNGVDHFILDRLIRENLRPSEEADRYALIRRVSLDLTGLPPTLEEVDEFIKDDDPRAYDNLVDRLLAKETYGEHWARKWLDLARYADSAGYADDPPRTIWEFRNYVIRSLNANKPFDQFTIEQIAGDLLPNATHEQLVATAFHRNTMTNNEGGTNDEEFRNVAVVDRVNTTMAVWMGTTIDCAQCHNHKYDPISQQEYFQLFAVFNNTQDADVKDERPLLDIWTDEQTQRKEQLQAQIGELQKKVATATPELLESQKRWESLFAEDPPWRTLTPVGAKSQNGASLTIESDGTISAADSKPTDVYTVQLPLDSFQAGDKLTALRLDALPDESLPSNGPGLAGGNFVITRVLSRVLPPADARLSGRYVRVQLPGKKKILSLAEVQVFSGSENIARTGKATQSSVDYKAPAELAVDGKQDGDFYKGSVTHTATSDDPWWELDLGSSTPLDRIVVWNRTDNNLQSRLSDFRVSVLDENRQAVWETAVQAAPNPNVDLALDASRSTPFVGAYADHSQTGYDAANVLDSKEPNKTGWAVAPQFGRAHSLNLIPKAPIEIEPGSKLEVTIEQLSEHPGHTLGRFALSATLASHAAEYLRAPADIRAILKVPADARNDQQASQLTSYYLSVAPELARDRTQLANLTKQLEQIKPYTTVPVMRELPEGQRRVTKIHNRGNYLDQGEEVQPGLPEVFHEPETGWPIDRLTLAKWLVDPDNPLTSRVIANRYWEAIFGVGLVRTSEEFGSQGELPSHPELLDWLACELVESGWDLKAFLRMLVTSAAYKQSSRVTPELYNRDPENRLLARGPRFRLTAEMIRDQALFVSGLLSLKMYGPPVKPPQPTLGLSAAFGGGIDWATSAGEDKHRRGLYTTWRRSNPYPSMTAFDAPNREVCTVRRDRTNTPLQALVTLNDPVYIEAAQALARRMAAQEGELADKARFGFRLCLARPPQDAELAALVELYEEALARYAEDSKAAEQMATQPLGPAPAGADVGQLAAWTVVGNVLLNLDEMFLKR